MTRALLVAALVLALTSSASATTWFVKPDGSGDLPTIQAALDAADDGDEILLDDGTFTGPGNRDLRWLGKELRVRSASGDAASCTIDCENAIVRGFWFDGNEGPLSVLEGITVARSGLPALDLSHSSPTIRNVLVRDNGATAVQTQGGSPRLEGVECRDGGTPTLDLAGGAPILSGCLFEANTLASSRGALELSGADATLEGCTFRDYVRGDVSYLVIVSASSGNVVLRDCVITGNPVHAVSFSTSSAATLTLENCLLEDNLSDAVRFVAPPQGPLGTLVLRDCVLRRTGPAIGAGIRLGGRADALVERCTIEGFVYGMRGEVNGGYSALSFTVRDCRIRNNARDGLYTRSANATIESCEIRGNGAQGAILHGHGTASVLGCLIAGNGGSGLQLRTFANATIERTTIASNGVAASGGGIEVLSPAGALTLRRTIVWDNCSADGSEILIPGGSSIGLDCVDLDLAAIGGEGAVVIGGEVLGTDPLFCAPTPCGTATSEGIYTLAPMSPASKAACGHIGALGVVCQAPTSIRSGVEVRSWGSIKSLYR